LTFKVIYIFKFIFVVKDIVERSRKLKWSSFKHKRHQKAI
jgi:hypothetical protein